MKGQDFILKIKKLVCISFPYLSGLVNTVEILEDSVMDTIGISENGIIIFNSDWFCSLLPTEACFVFAHELLHLVFKTHSRAPKKDPFLFNIAHDLVINEKLKKELNIDGVPAGGLDMTTLFGENSNLKYASAEKIYIFLQRNEKYKEFINSSHWNSAIIINNTSICKGSAMASALRKALKKNSSNNYYGDLISKEREELFPIPKQKKEQEVKRLQKLEEEIKNSIAQEVAQKELRKLFDANHDPKHGMTSDNESKDFEVLRSFYQPPWEMALQQWMEITTRTNRSYYRASRRGIHNDFVLPGYRREGKTLHLLLDTSGSMVDNLSKILGIIASFCESMMISQIHLLQCDVSITSNEWIYPNEVHSYTIRGLGGSDLSEGMRLLSKDLEIENLIVITDGYIDYPNEPMPYEVLWVLTESSSQFMPNYGKIISIPMMELS